MLLKPEKFDFSKPRRALPDKKTMAYYLNPANRGYLLTEAGKERLKEGGMAGAYLGNDGHVHIPGKRLTLYSKPSPPQDEQVGGYNYVINSYYWYLFVYTNTNVWLWESPQ